MNSVKAKRKDRLRNHRRRLLEQSQRREATPGSPQAVLADLPPDLADAMAALANPSRLYATVACYRQLGQWQAECVARGGEYLAVLVQSSNATSCCGTDFVAVSTVPMCDDPTCQADHRATAEHAAMIRDVLRLRGPSKIRVSSGWPAGMD